eukprot:629412-Prymnesium_polylepis.1
MAISAPPFTPTPSLSGVWHGVSAAWPAATSSSGGTAVVVKKEPSSSMRHDSSPPESQGGGVRPEVSSGH